MIDDKADKLEKTMNLIEDLQKLYPNLPHIAVDNLNDPGFIMIASDEFLEIFSSLGASISSYSKVDDEELFEELLESIGSQKLIGFDGNDEGEGNLH